MPTLPAEYASKPLAVFTKLAAMLRIVPAVRLVFAKFAALLRSKESGAPVISELLDGGAASLHKQLIGLPLF
jgi:hypothetical protein